MSVNKMYPIWHRACGTVLFYFKEQPEVHGSVFAESTVLLDCTQPKAGDNFSCPQCGILGGPHELGYDESGSVENES